MFRKTTLLIGALALLLVAPQAQAAKGDCSIGVGGGVSLPMGDFGDFAKLGFLGGASFDYMLNDMISIGVDGSYVMNSGKDEFNTLAGLTDSKQTIMQFGAHGKYLFPMEASSVSPYVVAGAGLFNGKVDITPNDPLFEESSDTKFGGRIGAGVDFKAGESLKVGIEGNFNHVSTEGSSTQYVTVLGRVSFPIGGSK